MTRWIPALIALAACAGPSTEPPVADTDPAHYEPTCEPPSETACDNPAASLRGTVRVAPGLVHDSPLQGDLLVSLTHEWLGSGATGGIPHTGVVLEDVGLGAGPVPFELDMCDGTAMWSEDNCSYQLAAILDLDGDQGRTDLTPDEGELAGRVQGLSLSCEGESPCLDLVLDCVGPACTTFADPADACACAETTCSSDFVTCE